MSGAVRITQDNPKGRTEGLYGTGRARRGHNHAAGRVDKRVHRAPGLAGDWTPFRSRLVLPG